MATEIDVKFSEFTPATELKDSASIPILQDGQNMIILSPVLESKIINKTVSRVIEQGGASLNLINLKGVVPTYADLATIAPTPELNDAYQVEGDGLVYVYTENGFQTDGEGFIVQPDANGVIETGNTDPVSGGTVKIYVDTNINDAVNLKKTISLEIGAIVLNTGVPTASTTRARSINFETSAGYLNLQSTNLFLVNVIYYVNGVWSRRENLNLLKTHTVSFLGSENQYKVVLSKNPNTDTVIQSDIDNSILKIITQNRYDFESIETFKPIKLDYDNAKIEVNTSINELGGILNTTGVNSDNNIRIRSKDKVSVELGYYTIENVTSGYRLANFYKYKDNVYIGRVALPPLSFTVDSTYNQYRLVWEKLDNTQIITQQEVNDFIFNVYSPTNDKITKISYLVSEIPEINNRLTSLESQDNPFLGKKVSFLGDSITTFSGYITGSNPAYYPAGDVTTVDKTWWMKLINRTGMILDTNNSYSGSTMAGTTAQSFCSRVSNIGNPDICFIFGGANDYRQNIPLGSFNYANTTFDRTQFKQSLQYILYNALNNNPLTRFIVILPTNRNDQGTDRVNGFPINYNQVKYLAPYQEAIIEACNTYGVEYIDTRGLWSYYNVGSFTIDALHPNSLGMVKFEDYIYKKI